MDEGENQTVGQQDIPQQTNPSEKKKPSHLPPQDYIDAFWKSWVTKTPGKVFKVLPEDVYQDRKVASRNKDKEKPKAPSSENVPSESTEQSESAESANASYESAKKDCIAAVEKIVKECRRTNTRYRDKHFDLEFDLLLDRKRNCLEGLVHDGENDFSPKGVKSVPAIFEKPQFTIGVAKATDIRQGQVGDCWFLAALMAVAQKPSLLEQICVARDERVGVYGFVFHRDGEWIYTVIDDKLYLKYPNYNSDAFAHAEWLAVIGQNPDTEKEYIKVYQTGSRALYFAQSADQNETWVPLLEKAFAKAHGDYESIAGGFTGEGIEDLTGGISTELFAEDILDLDLFWKELLAVNVDFLFDCATGTLDNWQPWGVDDTQRDGIIGHHAYAILEAREVKDQRLVKVRNPWGQTEWKGRWSDGSEEWTPEWMALLNHRFGNDGVFWISFEDLLVEYSSFGRTRLFDASWSLAQQWTSVPVPWAPVFNPITFSLTIEKEGPVVIALTQLDDRYWSALKGRYKFSFSFRLDKDGEDDYVIRSRSNYLLERTVSVDFDIDPGTYTVLMLITAERSEELSVEAITRETCLNNRDKFLQVGLSYDLAHAKGLIVTGPEDEKEEEALKEKKTNILKKKAKEAALEKKRAEWEKEKRSAARKKREEAREDAHEAKKEQNAPPALAVEPTENGDKAEKNDEDTKKDESKPAETTTSAAEATTTPKEKAAETAAPSATTTKPEEKATDAVPPTENGVTATDSAPDPAESEENHETIVIIEDHPNEDAAKEEHDDIDSVISFADSIDTILDLPEKWDEPEEVKPEWDDDFQPFADDPWNAICVLGLRVWTKNGGSTIRVVKVVESVEDDEETPLDVDDQNKGVSDDGAIKHEEGIAVTMGMDAKPVGRIVQGAAAKK